jgi:hypothetical protein
VITGISAFICSAKGFYGIGFYHPTGGKIANVMGNRTFFSQERQPVFFYWWLIIVFLTMACTSVSFLWF